MRPKVSILIPCLNEVGFIGKMLETTLLQDYRGELEILVIDGMSTDGTREIVENYAALNSDIELLDNERGIVPTGLNQGVRRSSGGVIVRMDAHAEYPTNYVSRLVEVLFEEGADNTGGVWKTCSRDSSLISRAIVAATTSPFGIGNARYRLGADAIIEVDTVPFGCYRREVFERIGLFDEELARNQDDEFNSRLRRSGGRILLVPDVVVRYYARPRVRQLGKMFYHYGLFKPLVARKVGRPATVRQFLPPAFVIGTVIAALMTVFFRPAWLPLSALYGSYLLVGLGFSLKKATSHREPRYLFVLPWLFWVIHVCYGWGYLKGLVKVLWPDQERAPAHLPISR